ncbi:MAG: Rieske (2Fe-2S) protein [Actinomycetota bacterium]|nr:Rieske (2Fe-2S) protein [Actinomycetota bacterium]
MKAERLVAIAFGLSVLSSLGLVAVYVAGGDAQVEGVLLGLALGGLGAGIVVWATRLLHEDVVTEERGPLGSPAAREDAAEVLDDPDLTRRSMLVRMLIGASGTLAAALAIPALSLGPRPGQSLFRTQWVAGKRLVDVDGNPVRAEEVLPGTVQTVFPEGGVGAADAQTVLLKVDPAALRLPEGRQEWAPEGVLGYSKICTHAGCPVGLYRAESHELLCPCHQSTFDVLIGAVPNFGPADRPLPQLPIDIDEEGYLIATGDFSEPVGPGFWNLQQDEGEDRAS